MIQAVAPATAVAILGSAHHGALGIVRSLGRMGIPVYVLDAAHLEPASGSRYCQGHFVLDIEEPHDESVRKALKIGGKLGGRPLLIPTADQGAIWVAEHAAALQGVFRFPNPGAALVRQLCDKGQMQELARQCGVSIAQSVVPRSKEDVEQFLQSAVFPVMVKATDAARLRRRAGGTKFLIHTRDALLELYARAEDRVEPNLLIQEFIPGEDWMFDGYFGQNSQCLLGATAQKIRRFPVNTGVTSLGICRRNDAVMRITTDFMKAIGYRGILDIGYRCDSRTGEYKVLDVNPRIGCTFRLFTATNGMDVARALYLDMTGQTIDAAETEEGRKWIVEDFDLFSALRSWRNGDLTVKDWAKSLRGVKEAACFAVDDPLPFLMTGVADCADLCGWMRSQADVRKGGGTPSASPRKGVPNLLSH